MALPRLETIGFRAAVHKPMGDVTDVTSISFIQSVVLTLRRVQGGTLIMPEHFGADQTMYVGVMRSLLKYEAWKRKNGNDI